MKTKRIIGLITITLIVLLISYFQVNSFINIKPPKELKTNYKDKNINYNNTFDILKNITNEQHQFGSKNSEITYNIIKNYLDEFGIKYEVQENIIDYDWLLKYNYNTMMNKTKEDFIKLGEIAENESLDEWAKKGGFNSYEDFLYEIIEEAHEYSNYKEYYKALIQKEYDKYELEEIKINNIIVSIGEIDPNKDSYIFSVHYDSGDDSYGALDNGMNVAAMLESIRVLKDNTFDNNIYIAIINGEEKGFYGSDFIINDFNIPNIKGVINFDNCGAGGKLNLYKNKSNYLVNNYYKAVKKPHINTFISDVYKLLFDNDFGSDYDNYSLKYDAIDFALFMNHKNYHTSNDTYENINSKSLKETTDTMYQLINNFGKERNIDNNEFWYFEIADGIVIKLNYIVYIAIMVSSIVIAIILTIKMILDKKIYKTILSIIFIVLSILSLIFIKSIAILLVLLLLTTIIENINIKQKNYLILVGYIIILFEISRIAMMIMSLNLLGLVLYIIPLLYVIYFIKDIKKVFN